MTVDFVVQSFVREVLVVRLVLDQSFLEDITENYKELDGVMKDDNVNSVPKHWREIVLVD